MARVGVSRGKGLARSGAEHLGERHAGLSTHQRSIHTHPRNGCGDLRPGNPEDVEADHSWQIFGRVGPILRGVLMSGIGLCHSDVIVPRRAESLKRYEPIKYLKT